MKECGTLGFVLALAVTPRNLLLWGGLLIVCIGMYIAGERSGATKESACQSSSSDKRKAVKISKP